jgi:hypothetical protein
MLSFATHSSPSAADRKPVVQPPRAKVKKRGVQENDQKTQTKVSQQPVFIKAQKQPSVHVLQNITVYIQLPPGIPGI